MDEAMKNNQVQTCPQCDNHCPVETLQCGRGRKYFGVADGGHEHNHGHKGEKYHKRERRGDGEEGHNHGT